jgi:uncharacterized protein YigE (DUF2233 family)
MQQKPVSRFRGQEIVGRGPRSLAVGLLAAGLLVAASASAEAACAAAEFESMAFTVCRFDPATDDIRIFHADASGAPFGHFARLRSALAERGARLTFAMNAGMYHPNRAPVGLLIEEGVVRAAVNRRDCSGNFCLKPNGVFWIGEGENGRHRAHVSETEAYLASAARPRHASQSGPMLVIDGAIHPRFLIDSTSRYRRNGVGVTDAGEVVFAISEAAVTFHEFARFFRDELKTPNALYFDGSISRLYSLELRRNDPGPAMGPIVAVVDAKSP